LSESFFTSDQLETVLLFSVAEKVESYTHSVAANSATEIDSDSAGGMPCSMGSIGFMTAARPTDFVGDIFSVINTTTMMAKALQHNSACALHL